MSILMNGIILIGPPKSGKTVFARRLASKCKLAHLSLDALIDAFENIFPEHGITHDGPSTAQICANAKPFVEHWLERQLHYRIPFLLEGFHLDLESLHQRFSERAVRIVCIGYPSMLGVDKVTLTRKFSVKPDWTDRISDDKMMVWFDHAAGVSLHRSQVFEPVSDAG